MRFHDQEVQDRGEDLNVHRFRLWYRFRLCLPHQLFSGFIFLESSSRWILQKRESGGDHLRQLEYGH